MSERLRWKVADLLNRSRRTCWANLVTWALGRSDLAEVIDLNTCHLDAARNGTCYCGKVGR